MAPRSGFGALLDTLLEKRRLSARAFAKQVKVSKSLIHLVMTGERPIPPKRIETWADALELQAKERERFVEEAWLTHCPEYIVERYRGMKKHR